MGRPKLHNGQTRGLYNNRVTIYYIDITQIVIKLFCLEEIMLYWRNYLDNSSKLGVHYIIT